MQPPGGKELEAIKPVLGKSKNPASQRGLFFGQFELIDLGDGGFLQFTTDKASDSQQTCAEKS